MESFFIHLLKSSAVLLLFITVYQLFLKKETFFENNRVFLILGPIIAVALPFITITKTILIQPSVQQKWNVSEETIVDPIINETLNWSSILIGLYSIGLLYFTFRLILQYKKIIKLKKQSEIVKDAQFTHVKTNKRISPFSFFNNIFYYPKQFTEAELFTIITHEKVHVIDKHSVDVLITEIVSIILWFNPFIWWYKIMVKQNLEYIADAKTCAMEIDKKSYQYLMLKQTVSSQTFSIINPFFNSFIKKRIVMINQQPSKKSNQLKLFIILPAIVLFLMSFNTKEVFEVRNNKSISQEINTNENAIDLIITKNTTNKNLENIKNQLRLDNVDFSFTAVRNSNGEIIDLTLSLVGNSKKGSKTFSGNYQSDSIDTIDDVIIKYDPKTNYLFIGDKKGAQNLKSDSWVISTQINEVKIEVDKNSKNETLKSDSEFLKENGVTISYRGIKRNKNGEITAIKVHYNNNAGEKGTYQQIKSTPIAPFSITVNLNEDDIKISTVTQTNNYTDSYISKEEYKSGKIVEIRKNNNTDSYYLNGKELTQTEMENLNSDEKSILSFYQLADSLNFETEILETTSDDGFGNIKQIKFLKDSSNTNQRKYLIIEKRVIKTKED